MKLIEIKNLYLYTTRITEIEYLENSGTQYIDTGVLMNSGTAFRGTTVEFEVLELDANMSAVIAGAASKYYHNYNLMVDHNEFYKNGGFNFSQYNEILNTRTTATVDNRNKEFSNTNFILFGRSTLEPSQPIQYDAGRVRIYSCKIIKNDNTIRDFVPVRIGTKGYMLDKVSGELYGNSKTGDFILGQDVGYINGKTLNQIHQGLTESYNGWLNNCSILFDPATNAQYTNYYPPRYDFYGRIKVSKLTFEFKDFGFIQISNTQVKVGSCVYNADFGTDKWATFRVSCYSSNSANVEVNGVVLSPLSYDTYANYSWAPHIYLYDIMQINKIEVWAYLYQSNPTDSYHDSWIPGIDKEKDGKQYLTNDLDRTYRIYAD